MLVVERLASSGDGVDEGDAAVAFGEAARKVGAPVLPLLARLGRLHILEVQRLIRERL